MGKKNNKHLGTLIAREVLDLFRQPVQMWTVGRVLTAHAQH